MMERWDYEDKRYRIDCISLPAAKWRSKVRLLSTLEQLKVEAASDKKLSSYADVLFFEFTDSNGERVTPGLDKVRDILVNRTSPVCRYDQFGQTVHRELLVRRRVEKLRFEHPMCAWAFFRDYCSKEASICATNQDIWGVFHRYNDPGFMPVYKTDAYCHHNTNEVWGVEDLANPLNLIPPMFGISINQVMLAAPGCLSSVHVEDGKLGSYNVILIGRKLWFFVVDLTGRLDLAEMGKKLEAVLRSILKRSGEVGDAYWKCPNFLKSKLYAFTPELQENHELRLITIEQSAGQAVLTSTNTYHLVLTLEPTVSIAVNYMPLNYVPSLADFCLSRSPTERELHRGNLRVIYDTLVTEWGDINKLKACFVAELTATGLKGYGLPGQTTYSGNINSIFDKKEQLQECMEYNRLVWTNLHSGRKEGVPVKLLHVTDEYAVVSYGLRQPFCRPLQSIEVYPERYEDQVEQTNRFRLPNIRVPDLGRFAVLFNRTIPHPQQDEANGVSEEEQDDGNDPGVTVGPPLELDDGFASEIPCQPGMPETTPAQLPAVNKHFKFVVNGVPPTCTNGCVHRIFSRFGTIFGMITWGRKIDQYLVIYRQEEDVQRLLKLSTETPIKHAGVELTVLAYDNRRVDKRRNVNKRTKRKDSRSDEEGGKHDDLRGSKKRCSSTTIVVNDGGVVHVYNK